MSNACNTWAWAQLDIGGTDKLVLVCMAEQIRNDDGYTFMSQAAMAKLCGISERSVRTALANLEAAEKIIRKKVHGKLRNSDDIWLRLKETVIFKGRTGQPAEIAARTANRQKTSSQPADFAAYTQTDTPSEGTDVPSSGRAGASASGNPPARRRFVPEGWEPTEGDIGYAQQQGLDPPVIKRELEKFKLTEFAEPRSDWSRCWKKWVLTAAERMSRHDNQPSRNDRRVAQHVAGAKLALELRRGRERDQPDRDHPLDA